MVGTVLEDFGLRRPSSPAEPPLDTVADRDPDPNPEPVGAEPPRAGLVWHGSARRSVELQRFCDHLAGRRDSASLVDR